MRGISESSKRLIRYARQLLEVDHPQTLRQLHYAIFSRQEIDYANDKASYQRLSRATTIARRTRRAWELDGDSGSVETAIKGLIDFATWDRQVAIQDVEFNCIADIAARMKTLPQLERR